MSTTIANHSRLINPFSFKEWIENNREFLKPPVGNKVIFRDSTFIVMVVGGPNSRTDFHVNQTDEFFYQIEGDISLRIVTAEGNFEEIAIKEGEIFLLPAGVPHSPQRSAKSVGLVIEKTRTEREEDGMQWFCKKCGTKLYEEFFHLHDIETQFPAVFDRYYNSDAGKCACGHLNGKEWK